MNRAQAIKFGTDKLKEHGLYQDGWRMQIDSRPKRRLGQCRYDLKEIAVSSWCLNGGVAEGKVENTIIHELAHSLTRGDGHGRLWKQKCVELGIDPQRCATQDQIVEAPKAKYSIRCCGCEKIIGNRHRTSKLIRNPFHFRSNCCKADLKILTNF